MTQPLPPVGEDPSILAGDRVKQTYAAQSQAVRGDFNLTDVAKAEQIDALWTAANTELARLYTDLQNRRDARIDTLSATVPLGPDVPDDASRADAAVLQQVFRASLAAARDATPAQQAAMLADAERFDDDTQRRAVLTAAAEESNVNLIREWTDVRGLTAAFDELLELQQVAAGQHFWHLREVQALGVIDRPAESFDLPRLIAARDAAVRASNAMNAYRR